MSLPYENNLDHVNVCVYDFFYYLNGCITRCNSIYGGTDHYRGKTALYTTTRQACRCPQPVLASDAGRQRLANGVCPASRCGGDRQAKVDPMAMATGDLATAIVMQIQIAE